MADRVPRLLSSMYTVVDEKASDHSKESRVEGSASEFLLLISIMMESIP